MNTLPFYIFLFLHLTFLIVGFGAVLVIDFLGIVWIRGKISKRIFAHVTRYTRKLIWLGWIGLVCSGVGLIILKGYIDNLTKLKLFFVLMIGVNGVILGSIQKSLDKADGDSIPVFLKFRIVIATIVSQIGWWGAITIGFLHRHWQHNIPWPDNFWLYILSIVLSFGILVLVGRLLLPQKQYKTG